MIGRKPAFAGVAYVKVYLVKGKIIVALPKYILVASSTYTRTIPRRRHMNIEHFLRKKGLLPPKRVPRPKT
jgi:hypothetical protein